jgi:choline dehydrogenase-like flavoprotein
MLESDCDVVVVGAGIAGALIAYKAASAGLRTVILEAGVPLENREQLVETYYRDGWPYSSASFAPQPNDPGPNWRNSASDYWEQVGPYPFASTYERRLGGTTLHWLGTAMRFVPNDFSLRSSFGVEGAVDWPICYNDLETWYGSAEVELGVAGDQDQASDFDGPRSQAYPMPPIAQSFLDSQIKHSIDGSTIRVDDRDIILRVLGTPQARNSIAYDKRPPCMGNSSCVPICPIQAKYDATVHLKKAVNSGAKIYHHCVVSRLDVDLTTNSINSVRFRRWSDSETTKGFQEERVLRARLFVVAANAVETAKILLMSPWREEAYRSVGVANSSDQVGRNLMDHLCYLEWGLMPDPVFPYRGPLSTSGIEVFRDGSFRKERAAYRIEIGNDGWSWPSSAPQSTVEQLVYNEGLFGSRLRQKVEAFGSRQFRLAFEMESLPLPESRVRLSELNDAIGLPRPKISYDISRYTLEGFKEAKAVAKQIFGRLGLNDGDVYTFNDPQSPCAISYGGSLYQYRGAGHIMGTYRMGNDPRTSVVDRNQRSHDHFNLYLVGSGTFCSSGTANPTLTIAALALSTADYMIKDLQSRGYK